MYHTTMVMAAHACHDHCGVIHNYLYSGHCKEYTSLIKDIVIYNRYAPYKCECQGERPRIRGMIKHPYIWRSIYVARNRANHPLD